MGVALCDLGLVPCALGLALRALCLWPWVSGREAWAVDLALRASGLNLPLTLEPWALDSVAWAFGFVP